jgi:peptidoglycan hydrolase-like protein with peptidoglycan-binding domain
MMKIGPVAAFLFGCTSVCHSQTGYIVDQPSIDCTETRNTVALILCSGPEGARADWDLNSASWALYFAVDESQRPKFNLDQQAWRQSLDAICALPRQLTQQEQAQQLTAQTMGRMILGPRLVLPRPPPITQGHVNCVLNAYRARAAMLRSRLTGDALAESRLTAEQHVQIQQALAEKGFLRADQIGSGTYDGEFGPITRSAIKQFQRSLGVSPSGFLSGDQWTALLERPGEREAREARRAVEAQAMQAALAAQDARAAEEAKRKQEAENRRLEAEAEAARQWHLRVDEARVKGLQYADTADSKWSLSETDNPMTDDKDYTVTSVQSNGKGALAVIDGTCQKPGRVAFGATLHDASDSQSSLGLPDFDHGYIAGNKRVNVIHLFQCGFRHRNLETVFLFRRLLV